jgi:hypothetical protein
MYPQLTHMPAHHTRFSAKISDPLQISERQLRWFSSLNAALGLQDLFPGPLVSATRFSPRDEEALRSGTMLCLQG